MQGSIRFFVGLFLVFSGVQTMDTSPELFPFQPLIITIGLILMFWGVKAMKEINNE